MSGYRAKKRLGQNFLKTSAVIERVISELSPLPDDTVVEVGPGLGALTVPLAESGCELWAVEFDRDLIEPLEARLLNYDRVHLINQDFLEFDPDDHRLTEFKLIGNLPYNITTPVIDWCLNYRDRIKTAVLMVQKELGARIAGRPGTKDWSPLALFTQLSFEVVKSFDVSPKHFRPAPNVMSTVLRLTPRTERLVAYTPALDRVVRTAFRHRRKQMVNNLTPVLVPDADQAREILGELSLDPRVRAEELTIEQFLKLTDLLVTRKLV